MIANDYALVSEHGQDVLRVQFLHIGLCNILNAYMTQLSDFLPAPSELARQVAVFPTLKQRRQHQSNVWFFDSPKNNKRIVIKTDLAFMHLVLLEGDITVSGYVVGPAVDPAIGSVAPLPELGAHVYRTNGTVEWWEFARLQKERGKRSPRATEETQKRPWELAAHTAGVTYCVKTDADLAGLEFRFDNWLNLCAAINRCRTQFLGNEADMLRQRMDLQGAVVLDSLVKTSGIDPACMLAVVAIALQNGVIHTNLDSQLFGCSSLLSRVGR